MDQETLDYYRKKLLEARERVLERVKKAQDYGRSGEGRSETMDIVDQASSSYEKEFHFSLSNTDRQILQEIEDALQRMKEGRYGFCEHTGEPIGPKRLEAVPWARLSREAQELAEQGRL